MGQKTNPIGLRLGIIRGWDSNWFASKTEYPKKLIEDNKIRNYLNARINKGGISKIVIERTLNKLIVTIHTSKPGIIIGKGGGEVDRIKEELKKLCGKEDVQINILEIRRPELDANIVADTIARQLENRINYKRAIKMSIASALRMGAEGIKVKVGGRLGGAEIARDLNPNVVAGGGKEIGERQGGFDRRDDRRDDRRGGGGGGNRGGGGGNRGGGGGGRR